MPEDWVYCVFLSNDFCSFYGEHCVKTQECEFFEDSRHHKHESWQTDFSVCPDCGTKQLNANKKAGRKCENSDCETVVLHCHICGKLIWRNDNWG